MRDRGSANRELERIEEQLRRSLEGGAWHGPALSEALEGLTSDEAVHHPLGQAHSIWEVVLHLTSTYRLVLKRIGGDARPLTQEEDWPPTPEPTERGWEASLAALRSANRDIRRAVLAFDPERLDEPLVPGSAYSAHVQFIGLTQHDAYHAGQIILLRRALPRRSGA